MKEMRELFMRLEVQGYPKERQEVSLVVNTPKSEAGHQSSMLGCCSIGCYPMAVDN